MAGSGPLVLGFAGLVFSLETQSGEIAAHLERRYGSFRLRESGPSHFLKILTDTALDQASPNSISIEVDGSVLSAESSSLELEFEFADAGGEGLLRVAPEQLFIDIENPLRILVAHCAARRGMLLVHAAAISRPGGKPADLFAGYSGAGKSTISRLAAGAGRTVISDDIILADPSGEKVRIFSTPLGSLEGPAPRPADAVDVGTLYFIEHGGENSAARIEASAALVRLASVVPFTPSAGTSAFQNVLDAAARIVEKVESSVFSFVPDETALAFLEERKR